MRTEFLEAERVLNEWTQKPTDDHNDVRRICVKRYSDVTVLDAYSGDTNYSVAIQNSVGIDFTFAVRKMQKAHPKAEVELFDNGLLVPQLEIALLCACCAAPFQKHFRATYQILCSNPECRKAYVRFKVGYEKRAPDRATCQYPTCGREYRPFKIGQKYCSGVCLRAARAAARATARKLTREGVEDGS